VFGPRSGDSDLALLRSITGSDLQATAEAQEDPKAGSGMRCYTGRE
jgi:hypothetical protein